MILGVAVRIFATREGILPETKFVERMLKRPIFEIGSMMGILMLTLGVFGVFQSIDTWGLYGFSELPANLLARQLSLSGMLGVLGGITLSSSLLFGFLSLPMIRTEDPHWRK
jgi:hypothetical protein